MKPNDYDQFANLLQALADMYRYQLTPAGIQIWWSALEDMDLAVIMDAMRRHTRNTDSGQFMPKPADIIRMATGSSQDKALQAWHKVDKAVRQIGTYQSVVFDDPLIHRVLYEMGGWIALGTKRDDEWPFVAREFEARYRAFASNGSVPEYLPVLPGILESENAREHPSAILPPMLLGDSQRAMAVMSGGTNQLHLLGRSMTPEAADRVMRLIEKNDVNRGRLISN